MSTTPSRNRRLDAVDERILRLLVRALLDPALDGAVGSALVLLRVATDVDAGGIEEAMAELPPVAQVLDLSGPWDYQVRVRFGSQQELYDVVNALRALPGVTAIETRTVLREVLDR